MAAVQYGVAETLLRGDMAKRKIGRLVSGVVLLLLSGLLALVAFALLLASFFFKLADVPEFIMPALITGLVASAIVVALVWQAWQQLGRR